MLQLMDSFAASYSTLFLALFELFVIAWVYGELDVVRVRFYHTVPRGSPFL